MHLYNSGHSYLNFSGELLFVCLFQLEIKRLAAKVALLQSQLMTEQTDILGRLGPAECEHAAVTLASGRL